MQTEEYGLCSLMMTLTADEMSDTRWPEVQQLEALAKRVNRDLTWKDVPVECTRLFVERTERFMKRHVLNGPDGVFGNVLHHMIRYELQGRCDPARPDGRLAPRASAVALTRPAIP